MQMTEKSLKFKVMGEVPPMPRPRTVSKGGKSWTFSGNKASREFFKQIKKDCPERHHFDSVMIRIFINSHKTHDVDNCAKTILDGLTGLLWDNDKVIWDLHITRLEAAEHEKPFCEIEVLGEEPDHVQAKLI